MNIKLEIRRNSDGALATEIWRGFEFSEFMWSDGNYSCDCNRELLFSRAREEDEPDNTDCGDHRFSVRISDADTFHILYDEFNTTR